MTSPFRICADVGNSLTKVAGYRPGGRLGEWLFREAFDDPPKNGLGFPDSAAEWIVSSVNDSRWSQLRDWLRKYREYDSIRVLRHADVPMDILVEPPTQLGLDRLLGAWGAIQLAPDAQPRIVVNAGTAVTIDLISDRGAFEGGVIFPGPQACFQQLVASTCKLPLVSTQIVPPDIVGKSTELAISSGVWQMLIGTILHVVGQFTAATPRQEPIVFLTGGAIEPVLMSLPSEWSFDRDLVLKGIQSISV